MGCGMPRIFSHSLALVGPCSPISTDVIGQISYAAGIAYINVVCNVECLNYQQCDVHGQCLSDSSHLEIINLISGIVKCL